MNSKIERIKYDHATSYVLTNYDDDKDFPVTKPGPREIHMSGFEACYDTICKPLLDVLAKITKLKSCPETHDAMAQRVLDKFL